MKGFTKKNILLARKPTAGKETAFTVNFKYTEILSSKPGLVIFVFLRVGSGKNCQLLLGEERRKESFGLAANGVFEQENTRIFL